MVLGLSPSGEVRPVGEGEGYVIERGDDDDGSRAYEFVCRKCALNNDKLKEIAMKDREKLDKGKLDALDNLIYLFAGLGLVGIIALIVKGLRALGDIAMVAVLAAVGVGGACAWIAAGGACVYWLLTA
jgi:hypothetical protein